MHKARFVASIVYILVLVASVGVVFPFSGLAQETTAAIQGVITDSSGAVVAGASVVATSPALIQPARTETDKSGFYRLNALPPGTYTVEVTAPGLSAKAVGIALNAGGLPTINLKLSLASTAETVEVSASEALINVTESKVETTVSQQMLLEIPKGRSFETVIPFAPGARQEPLQSSNTNRLSGYQIDGASNSENVFIFDGVNITNIQSGGVGASIPMEFVQDVQVKSSSFEAEYGGALGGVVNVIPRRGGSDWHGSFLTYYRANFLDANDQCNFGQVVTSYTSVCGLRYDPSTTANSTTRTDAAAQYYHAKQDHWRTIDPGLMIGGPVLEHKLWIFGSYIPDFSSTRRTVTFTKTNAGVRTFNASNNTHFGMVRADYSPFSNLRLAADWVYQYNRVTGSVLPNPDSITGQTNSSATSDPAANFRSDAGTANPQQLLAFTGDWTISPHSLLTARYGYWYRNTGDRGRPVGIRYLYQASVTSATLGLDKSTIPTAFQQQSGYANIGDNSQTLYDKYFRKNFDIDISHLKTGWYGTHDFKAGYSLLNAGNDVIVGYKTALVYLYYGQDYTPGTSATACDSIISSNVTTYGSSAAGHCRGNYGYFVVHDGVDTNGKVSNKDHAIYFQDSWTVGTTGLTINAGVRFDKEYLPPYSAGASSINFGFTDKVAPRIGGAYDLLRNGKIKVYASYGKFFDIMKYSLPRGSFGGEYWHDCAYAMDDPDYTKITPTSPNGHGCPTTGQAPGVSVGRFIENQDFRANVTNTKDPGVDPNIKPMQQHEFVTGVDWAVQSRLSLTARYARKRLDETIEDIGVTDNLGFYIGNPGPGYGDLLHRVLYAQDYTSPLCSNCPVQPKARRDYDGLEVRALYQLPRWMAMVSYAYSSLRGNYPGLTSTYASDGGGGRTSPNNNRSFDQPQMQFTSHGKPYGGKLPTDRPNTLQIYGYYKQPWKLGESSLGLSQSIFQGSPLSTCWPTITSASSCQFVEDQGSWVNLTRDSSGNFVPGKIMHDRRTPAFLQTNMNLKHSIPLKKEGQNLVVEMNVNNVLNQHAATSFNNNPISSGAVAPTTTSNPTGYDFYSMMTGWNYSAVTNSALKTLNSRYGSPNSFQYARTLRLRIAYTF